ncbi:MAG: SH3 domain-containing protein [Anaerolineae bacterium]
MTCFAVTNYNLRLRSAPEADAETLLTIPYSEAITLTAQTSAGDWFATSYDGQEGWVAGQYLTLGPNCDRLEAR